MEVRQIIVNSHDDEGFKVIHEYGEWKVGILNYNERFSKFKELENHTLTDEVFILVSGSATLYTESEKVEMKISKSYTVPANVWHHIVVSKDAKVIVIENKNTSKDNTLKKFFD